MGSKAHTIYKPRSTGDNSVKKEDKANMKNMKFYTQEQIDLQLETNEELIHFFGYADHPEVPSYTRFADYSNRNVKPGSIAALNGYKRMNEGAIKNRLNKM
jgi:hypothetical protein